MLEAYLDENSINPDHNGFSVCRVFDNGSAHQYQKVHSIEEKNSNLIKKNQILDNDNIAQTQIPPTLLHFRTIFFYIFFFYYFRIRIFTR